MQRSQLPTEYIMVKASASDGRIPVCCAIIHLPVEAVPRLHLSLDMAKNCKLYSLEQLHSITFHNNWCSYLDGLGETSLEQLQELLGKDIWCFLQLTEQEVAALDEDARALDLPLLEVYGGNSFRFQALDSFIDVTYSTEDLNFEEMMRQYITNASIPPSSKPDATVEL